jgi:hypothetical protein
MSAPGTEAAQSDAGTAPNGQGQDQDRSFSSILGEDAFSDAPEELREHLAEYVRRSVDPKLTQRFQEHAEFRNTWEPFSQIQGLTDLDPQDVDQLVELGYALAAAGDQNHQGHQQAVEYVQDVLEKMGTELGFFEDDDDGDGDGDEAQQGEQQYMTREQFEAEMQQREQQSQQQQAQQQTQQQIQTEINAAVQGLDLPGQPGSEERQQAEKYVYTLMAPYVDDASLSHEQLVQAAYSDYQQLRGGAQSDLIEDAENGNGGSTLRGGGADTAPEEVKSWGEARKLAKARMQQGAQ